MYYDILNLSYEDRELIKKVSPARAKRVWLASLDKGLSGAKIFLAKWELPRGVTSDYSVLKISERKKILREMKAFNTIVSELDNRVGLFKSKTSNKHSLGIIRQPFVGNKDGTIINLKHKLLNLEPDESPEYIIDRIYKERMRNWHPIDNQKNLQILTFGRAFNWWSKRYNLINDISRIGEEAVENEICSNFKKDLIFFDKSIRKILRYKTELAVGPVHGDLHAQNILFDQNAEIHLIDFGWTSNKWKAIDFLMLECSLKFLVAPANIRQVDIAKLEESIEFNRSEEDINCLKAHFYGMDLINIARSVNRIRNLCLEFGYVNNEEEYRMGLIILMSCLTAYPDLNQRYLIYSICQNILKLNQTYNVI